MKNRKLTMALIFMLVGIWGGIFHRIFVARDNLTTVEKDRCVRIYSPLSDYKVTDTFSLRLNYRDPFLKIYSSNRDTGNARNLTNIRTSALSHAHKTAPPINWDVVKYIGYVFNPLSKRRVAIMNIKGNEYVMNVGQKIEGVNILANYKDSVKVSYLNTVRCIKMH